MEETLIITQRRAIVGGIAALSISALLAGCSPAPATNTSSTSSAASGFKPCMVSDSGGFDDKSFNQLSFEGLKEASEKVGVKPITVESNKETDFAPNIESLIAQNCSDIVTVGFALSAATIEAAKKNPKVHFIIIDDAADADFDGKTDAPNIKPLLFNTAQAAFLAGYAAADQTKSGTVATWGGMDFPTVTIFMDGFAQGVSYYNTKKGKTVKVLGFDPASPKTATFVGGFEANEVAKTTAKNFIDQGADVLLPVGGPIYQSAAVAITDSGKDIALVGVDADLFVTDSKYEKLYLTSVLKGIKQATSSVVAEAAAGKFSNTTYIGDLKNDGVGIAPFHNFDSKVSASLKSELDALKKDIIAGTVPVKSYLAAK